MTEIRQASPFSETKTAAIRVPSRAAGNPAPAFELPSADRAAEARQNAPRPNPVREAAFARNAARDVAREAAESERPSRPSSTKAGHGHADDQVRGAKKHVESGVVGSVEDAAGQVEQSVDADLQAAVDQYNSPEVADDAHAAEVKTASAETAATELTEEVLAQLPGTAAPGTSPPAVDVPLLEAQAAAGQVIDAANAGSPPAEASAAGAVAVPPAPTPQVATESNGNGVAGQVEANQPILSGGGANASKPAVGAEIGEVSDQVGKKIEDSLQNEPGKAAKTEGETPSPVGKHDKDQPAVTPDAKAAEVKTPADAPAVAKDTRIELPAGFSLTAPKVAHDLHGAASAAQLPDAQPQVAEGRPTPINAVPLEIGLRALSGSKRFDIRLDPAELGRVDVRLEIDDAGTVTAKLTVDRVETLHLLQRDARTLERAFEQAGLKPSDGGVDISLRDQTGQPGSGQTTRDESEQNARRSRSFIQVEPDIAEAQVLRRTLGPGRIDLSI